MLSVNRGLVPQNTTYSIRSNSPSPTAVTDSRLAGEISIPQTDLKKENIIWSALTRAISMVSSEGDLDRSRSNSGGSVVTVDSNLFCNEEPVISKVSAVKEINDTIKDILKSDLLLLLVSDYVFVKFPNDIIDVKAGVVDSFLEKLSESLKGGFRSNVFNAFDDYFNVPAPWRVVDGSSVFLDSPMNIALSFRSEMVSLINNLSQEFGVGLTVSSYGHGGDVQQYGTDSYKIGISSEWRSISDDVRAVLSKDVFES